MIVNNMSASFASDNNTPIVLLTKVLSNQNMWAAIVVSFVIISLGFILYKIKVANTSWRDILTKLVLNVALPAMVLQSFMKPISPSEVKNEAIILGIAVAFYVVMCSMAAIWLNYGYKIKKVFIKTFNIKVNLISGGQMQIGAKDLAKSKKLSEPELEILNRPLTFWMMIIFGSNAFFAFPVIKELYPNALLAANLWNIPFFIFMFSFAYIKFRGLKFTKKDFLPILKKTFLNPVIIATIVGFLFWITQLIPGGNWAYYVNEVSNNTVKLVKKTNGWFNLEMNAIYVYKPFHLLGSTCSPLIWLAIGMTLAESKIKEAIKDKWTWIYVFIKLIILPICIFLIFLGILYGFKNNSDLASKILWKQRAISMVLFASTPPAAIVVAYAIGENKSPLLASRASVLSPMLVILMVPFWVVIGEVAFSSILAI